MTVNTSKLKEHRKLRFASIDEALQEVDRIVQAHQAGRLRVLGNWTVGQILAHLAAWIEYGYDGYPVKSPPWFVRVVLKRMVRRFLKKGMPMGVRIPGVPDGTVGQEDQPIEFAAQRLKNAFLRLKNGEPCAFDSPAFGSMSHQDRILLNLRHAELHLGFMHID
jgi:Protein of unknown function (DUF1569)